MGSRTAAQQRYGLGAIVLHWLLALALAFQLALGFAMPHHGPYSFAPMQLHKSVGIAILLLTLIRLIWRLIHPVPEAVERGLTAVLAKVVHWAFYAVLLLGPITGWIIVSTARLKVPTLLFGVVRWPHLPLPNSLGEPMESVHEALSWTVLVLFALHVLGALRHQFLLGDPVIRRMAPGGSVAAAMLLLVAAVAIYFGVGSYVSQKYLLPALEQPRRVSVPPAPPADRQLPAALPTAEAAAPEAASTASAEAAAPPTDWRIAGRKTLAFSLDNGGTSLSGSFKDWNATIRMDPDHPETAEIGISVALGSASVGDPTQDAMLQGADFFAASAHPTATWRSSQVKQVRPGHYRATGTLTIRGKSHPQALTFTLSGTGPRRHVTGSASIDRTAFGIGSGDAGASLSPLVSLSFAFDAAARER